MAHYKLTYDFWTPSVALPMTARNWRDVGHIVKLDIQRGIAQQVDADGKPYAALKPETVLRKSKPHHIDHPGQTAIPADQDDEGRTRYVSQFPSKRLMDGGNLFMNQNVRGYGDRAEISVGPTRIDAASGQMDRGTNFFAVSQTAAKNIMAYVALQIDKWLGGKIQKSTS